MIKVSARLSVRRFARVASAVAVTAAMVLAGFTSSSVAASQAHTAVAVAPQEVTQLATQHVPAALTPRPAGAPSPWPAPGVLDAPRPLGAPAPLATSSNAYKFLRTNPDGSPIAYNPCRPIHYVTDIRHQPAAGPQLVKEAISAVSAATGLVFIDDGATTEKGGAGRMSFQPGRYGDRWAPVLISWVTPAERADAVDVPTAPYAWGDSVPYYHHGVGALITGELDLNVAVLNPTLRLDHGKDIVRGVLEHELGHVVGLAHDNDEGQLMNQTVDLPVVSYQPGDLAGLARLGRGPCLGF